MKRILQASKDTYITNRIVNNEFRAIDANVGQAGTLDIFKLAGESTIGLNNGPFVSGSSDPIELSRVLIKFDLNPLRALTGSILDITHPSFKCTLKMIDVMGGQTVPSNYTLIVYPLSQSFDEGLGRDVYAFEDIDAANFVTASVSTGASIWYVTGANQLGYVGQENIDAVTGSAQLGNIFATQTFTDGDEDMSLDVTTIVSATLVGLLPDHGFRISFSGTQETDDRTRFVKRFASRHSTNTRIRPRIEVGFNDALNDHHEGFYFNVSGSLFLNNTVGGVLRNVISGAAGTQITGSNCMRLRLYSGSIASGTLFTKTVNVSQFFLGSNFVTGVYSASFAVSQFESGTLLTEVRLANSATFTEIWESLDGTIGYYTGSLVIKEPNRTNINNVQANLKLNITNMKQSYNSTEVTRFRAFAQDNGFLFKASRIPILTKSVHIDKAYYRIRDAYSDEIIFDFDTTFDTTRMSSDAQGLYFDVYMSDLDVGRQYCVDILVDAYGTTKIYEAVGGTFYISG
jgi:hypothetical protein